MGYVRDRQPVEDDGDSNYAGAGPSKIMSGYGAGTPSTPQANPGMSVTPLAPTQQAGSIAPGDGPSATGYVNFDRFFNANGDAAQNTANQVAKGVSSTAGAAKGDLSNVVSSFNSQAKAGTAQGPTADQTAWAQNGGYPTTAGAATGNGQKPKQTSPYGTALKGQRTATQAQPGLDSTSTRNPPPPTPVVQGAQTQVIPAHFMTQAASATPTMADLQKGAAGAYTGPTSLDVMSGYGAANDQKAAAQDQLGATSTDAGIQGLLQAQGQPGGYSDGMSAFDAGLVGQAGQGQFANERNQYGNLDQLFNDAGTNAQNTAQGDMATSLSNAGAYQGLENDYNNYQAPGAAQTDPGFIPTVGGETALNGKSTDSTQGQNIQQLGVGPQSGWDTFIKGQGTAGSGSPTTPSFNYVGDQGSPTPTVGSDGTINMPTGVGKAGPDWGSFWGNAPGAPSDGSNWNQGSDPTTANLTSAQWQNLSQMSPQQRAAWWAANHKP